MASRILNRRELREQHSPAEQPEVATAEPKVAPAPRKRKPRAPAAPRVKKPRARKLPPRMRARWGIFDNSMKQIAIFDYNQLGAAQAKLADLLLNKKSIHFMKIVKEPLPEAPIEAVS